MQRDIIERFRVKVGVKHETGSIPSYVKFGIKKSFYMLSNVDHWTGMVINVDHWTGIHKV